MARRDRNKKLFQPQEKIAFCYCPISTKLGMVLAYVVGVQLVLFESPRSNARRDVDDRLFRPRSKITFVTASFRPNVH